MYELSFSSNLVINTLSYETASDSSAENIKPNNIGCKDNLMDFKPIGNTPDIVVEWLI